MTLNDDLGEFNRRSRLLFWQIAHHLRIDVLADRLADAFRWCERARRRPR